MKTYVISFGDSIKYRLTADSAELTNLDEEIQKYLVKKFPEVSGLNFFDHMTVTEIDASNQADYADYPEFNENSIKEIKKVLSTEVEDHESLERLNSNAPWNNI